MSMEIRKVESGDVELITSLYNGYVTGGVETFETEPLTTEQMAARITATVAAGQPYLVAYDGDRMAGFCYAHTWKERAAYRHTLETTIYLDPAARRRGIGTALMTALTAECRRLGCKALIACITADNEASIAFHAKLGFVKVSHFVSVGRKFGRWLDVIDMELCL